MARVHFQFPSSGTPDLLLDNLMRGFYELGYQVTVWPDRPWTNSKAPVLRHPELQCWGGSSEDWLETYDAVNKRPLWHHADILIVTHAIGRVAFPLTSTGRKIAIDGYDRPLLKFRADAKAAGYRVFAREQPATDEIALNFPFNKLWAPHASEISSKFISVLVAGDDGVGRRREYAHALRDVPGVKIVHRLPYGEWQEALSKSRAVLVAHGAGERVFKLWEAAAAGCAPLFEQLTGTNSEPDLVNGENCLMFEPGHVDQLIEQAMRYATYPMLAARHGEAIREVAWARHTPEALARRMLAAIDKGA